MDQKTFEIWFTGFYEGEGSVSNDISNRNRLRISVPQNDPTPLHKAQKIWGGSVRKRTRVSLLGKICHGHEWVIGHNASLGLIDIMKPYMVIPYKISQIEKCLEKLNEKWEKKFKCSFCDNEYADRSGARRHELKEHVNKGVLFKCSCGTEYKSKDSLNRHIRLKKSDTSELKHSDQTSE